MWESSLDIENLELGDPIKPPKKKKKKEVDDEEDDFVVGPPPPEVAEEIDLGEAGRRALQCRSAPAGRCCLPAGRLAALASPALGLPGTQCTNHL